jgi:hypothetical protein
MSKLLVWLLLRPVEGCENHSIAKGAKTMTLETGFWDWDPLWERANIQRRIGDLLGGYQWPISSRWLPGREYPPVNVYSTDAAAVVAAENVSELSGNWIEIPARRKTGKEG